MSDKTPAEQALDLFFFAPLGIALYARDHLDELIAKGKTQVETQTNMAKMIGQLSVTMGRAELEKRLKAMTQSAPRPQPAPAPAAPAAAPTPATAAAPVTAPTVTAEDIAAPAPSADELGIPGYDALAASQVVARLGGLDPDELVLVRAYELAHRGRKTILSKIDQLQG